eukprot:CAMPEP_0113317414 /NCGR_PEP_ID=MMETSP0010_2-20120614/12333_1 /TAXON_ID=216773 ORGANISM="Corethron hystrix, Strain 308" /NCGR_SAMPLE_ID=MMETSP0010_2 /ASSEMBLY_ACC=CAM_ASM_000155 /LENGTH=118 /DNA_ID=CAMNT_0000174393 /DNA_START=265 /DNA_END=622 /DNA_ORIENTATION=- /assembly_acc=CAM_ASM_000155
MRNVSRYGDPRQLDFFVKGDVNGPGARDVFRFLKERLPDGRGSGAVGWNFAKFLLDSAGTPVLRGDPGTDPAELGPTIEELLRKAGDRAGTSAGGRRFVPVDDGAGAGGEFVSRGAGV